MTWPITWPESANIDDVDPAIKTLCELYAGACLTALTLHRVGGAEVTIMPVARQRISGHYVWYSPVPDEYPLGMFYPGTVYPSAQDLITALTVDKVEALELPGPIGLVSEVKIDGDVLAPAAYRIENGRYLVRLDGAPWPTDSGDNFTVTYVNSHPVGALGAHAGGIMAAEWLKLLTNAKGGCRLPRSVTSVSRQGITMEITSGMFPDGVTGLPEVDAFLMLWNPFGLKVAPRVYSPDLPQHRQVWHA